MFDTWCFMISGIKCWPFHCIINSKCTCKKKWYNNVTSKHIATSIQISLKYCTLPVTCAQVFPLQTSWNQYEMITFKIYTIYFVYFVKCILPSSFSTYGSFIEPLQSGTSVIAIAITLLCLTVVKQNVISKKLVITFIIKCFGMDIHPHDMTSQILYHNDAICG